MLGLNKISELISLLAIHSAARLQATQSPSIKSIYFFIDVQIYNFNGIKKLYVIVIFLILKGVDYVFLQSTIYAYKMQKTALPSGTRDFTPTILNRRKFIIATIEKQYLLNGFDAIETPAMELLSTLTGKYGEEGDQLLFKIVNSRLHEHKNKALLLTEFTQTLAQSYNSEILTERALRYDLTIPFARYVAMNRNDISLPFKRYQIQPVWRADRPQKGRYREFYQCDADIIGSDSLLNEVTLLTIIDTVFSNLNLNVTVKLNNRKLLQGICDWLEINEHFVGLTVAIDKWDKVGAEGVAAELTKLSIEENKIIRLLNLLSKKGTNIELLDYLSASCSGNELVKNGVSELRFIFDTVGDKIPQLQLDLTLARGLNYYTGCIVEVVTNDTNYGSILGGGRYDNLVGNFGWQGVSGVGISFGIDRIYDAMLDLNLFDKTVTSLPKTMLVQTDNNLNLILKLQKLLHQNNVICYVYPDAKKMEKQLEYANKNNFDFVIISKDTTIADPTFIIKNMKTGVQTPLEFSNLQLILATISI